MTPADYSRRIKALGFNTEASWYNFVQIDRTTHFRHKSGRVPIPKTLIEIVYWLEEGRLKNPNRE